MGLKDITSFLRKLTMGATATLATKTYLSSIGFEPVVLERQSASNKIWFTKLKGQRFADLLCTRTGLRVEVRGKSQLEIKMSDSPNKPDRRWDAGLRGEDLVALVPCTDGRPVEVRGLPTFFSVSDLRSSASRARSGPVKARSEGAERVLTWSATVPKEDGRVEEVTADHLRVRMKSGRQWTYSLKNKSSYVTAGQRFVGGASFLAGDVARTISPKQLTRRRWHPMRDLGVAAPADRHAAAVALGVSTDNAKRVRAALAKALTREQETRIALEIAGALARHGEDRGFEFLQLATLQPTETIAAHHRMEAVLILSELRDPRAISTLNSVAGSADLTGMEIRQAAVWGLGRFGVRCYEHLVKYIDDDDDDVALHAIAAFGDDASVAVIDRLVHVLVSSRNERARSAASEALRLIGSVKVAEVLIERAMANDEPWILATLGRLPTIQDVDMPDGVSTAIAPVRLLSGFNWLANPTIATGLTFLLQQDL